MGRINTSASAASGVSIISLDVTDDTLTEGVGAAVESIMELVRNTDGATVKRGRGASDGAPDGAIDGVIEGCVEGAMEGIEGRTDGTKDGRRDGVVVAVS